MLMIEQFSKLTYHGVTYNDYEISNYGRLRNIEKDFVYKTPVNKRGYELTSIIVQSKRVYIAIHRAVAETFIPNPQSKCDVNHIDGNKTNNTVTNLEWCTRSENMKHAIKIGLLRVNYGEDSPRSVLSNVDASWIRKHYISGDLEYGARPLGRKFRVDHSTILDIVNGISYNSAQEYGQTALT